MAKYAMQNRHKAVFLSNMLNIIVRHRVSTWAPSQCDLRRPWTPACLDAEDAVLLIPATSHGVDNCCTCRSDLAQRAMPPWATEDADVDIVCRLHQRVADVYPVEMLDIIVVGIFHQVISHP